ncbi:hypothetical protein BKA70DRAFT_1242914 [Coprinopsis sp. MPI-PUGE-AT-0042]|nr:hypothetical protein BKA70DRAFT_1242914 [Coprinopsis sp. MPI-PUGE-AT-0042]
MPRASQIPPRCALVRPFLEKLNFSHRAVAIGGSRQVLHYHSPTRSLVPWFWPIYGGEIDQLCKLELQNARVEPSSLEEYRRYYEFKAPSCLCALIDGVDYTESRIGVVYGGERGGTYAAECAQRRCGYRVLGLRIKKYSRRSTYSDEDPMALASDLFENEGIDGRRFWACFKQCDECQRIVMRRKWRQHSCPVRRCKGP